jgi:hypothetical protein
VVVVVVVVRLRLLLLLLLLLRRLLLPSAAEEEEEEEEEQGDGMSAQVPSRLVRVEDTPLGKPSPDRAGGVDSGGDKKTELGTAGGGKACLAGTGEEGGGGGGVGGGRPRAEPDGPRAEAGARARLPAGLRAGAGPGPQAAADAADADTGTDAGDADAEVEVEVEGLLHLDLVDMAADLQATNRQREPWQRMVIQLLEQELKQLVADASGVGGGLGLGGVMGMGMGGAGWGQTPTYSWAAASHCWNPLAQQQDPPAVKAPAGPWLDVYGSFATGLSCPCSDVDLLICGTAAATATAGRAASKAAAVALLRRLAARLDPGIGLDDAVGALVCSVTCTILLEYMLLPPAVRAVCFSTCLLYRLPEASGGWINVLPDCGLTCWLHLPAACRRTRWAGGGGCHCRASFPASTRARTLSPGWWPAGSAASAA